MKKLSNKKILLIRPTFGSTFQITPPLSLGYLASNLKKNGFSDIKIIDGTLHQLSVERAADIIKKEKPFMVGLQVYTGSQNWTKKLVEQIKKHNSIIKIVVGGPHISALKELAMKHIDADYGIIGEGEESLVKLVRIVLVNRVKEYSKIPGLIFKNNLGGFKMSKIPFAQIADLDLLPSPDYELLQIDKYFKYMQGASVPLKGKRPIPILTSRGCPFQCTFCSSRLIFLKKIRYRSVEKVIEELEYLKNRYHIDEFFVSDDNLTLDMARAEKLFDMLIEKKLKLHWRAPNGLRADRLDERLIRKMKESGCYFIGIGVETGSERVMKSIKKSLDLNRVSSVLPLLRKYKILTSGFFMVGQVCEDEQDVKKTLDFLRRSKFDRIQISIYTPYPGSEDFDNLFKVNDTEAYYRNVSNYLDKGEIPTINKALSSEQIHNYQKKMMKSFYLKPGVMLSLLSNFKLSQLQAILNHPSIKRWFKKDHASYLDDVR